MVAVITLWVAFGIACGIIADSKNRNVGGWIVLGILFGLISLIIVACLSKLEDANQQSKHLN